MKPHQQSIRYFFSPVSRSPQLEDATNPRPSPLGTASTPQELAPLTITSVHTRDTISTTPKAPVSAKATSPDALPPVASQTSANSVESKRIVSNGEQVVLNSDSDDDSLPELDWGTRPITIKEVAPVARSKHTHSLEGDPDDGLRKPGKKARSNKRAFNHVFKSALKNMEVEQLVESHKAGLADDEEEQPAPFVFDEDALGHAIQNQDDPEQTHRLFLAMQRTNALQENKVFHFFRGTSNSIAEQSEFPVHFLPGHRWTSSFCDASTREQAFLSGFAHQVFRLQQLPQELASWMVDQICLGRSETLHSKYLDILEAHNEHLSALLDRERLDAMFRTLGGDVKSLSSDAPLAPAFDLQTTIPPSLPRFLKSTALLLKKAAPWLRVKPRSHAFYLLCHACMDDRVAALPDVLEAVQDAIEATLCNFADNHKLVQGVGCPIPSEDNQALITSQLSNVLPQLLSRVTNPILQRDLARALPSSSPMTAYLKRHLALAFILYPKALDITLADHKLPTILHSHLENSPNFRINKNTNCKFLAARMTLLDIAIGPGLLNVPYQPLVSPEPSQGNSSPIMAPLPASSELKAFNKEVDALALHVKMLGNSIVEAGAVMDLSILEAKDSVERLCSRLEHAVRIGGKKSHNVFGNEEEDKQSKVTDMFRKVAANARKNASIKTGGIFDDDDEADVDEDIAAQLASEIARYS